MKTLDAPGDGRTRGAGRGDRSPRAAATVRAASAFKIAMYVFLIAVCGFILLPVGWMLTAALKPDLEPVFTPTPEWFPTRWWEWKNFRRVLTENMPFLRYMINTMIIVDREHLRRPDLVLARRLRVRAAALPREQGAVLHPDRDDADPVAGADGPAVPVLREARLVRHVPAADRAVVPRDRRSSSS